DCCVWGGAVGAELDPSEVERNGSRRYALRAPQGRISVLGKTIARRCARVYLCHCFFPSIWPPALGGHFFLAWNSCYRRSHRCLVALLERLTQPVLDLAVQRAHLPARGCHEFLAQVVVDAEREPLIVGIEWHSFLLSGAPHWRRSTHIEGHLS